MRLTKVLGLAVVAAFAAMAFIGVGSASAAKKDSVVICDQLVPVGQLCPEGHLWPKGSIILGLAEGGFFKGGSLKVECTDSVVEAKTTAEAGLALPFEIIKLEFGKLPVPTLGESCTGCTGGIHTAPPYSGEIEVEAPEDKFYFKSAGSATLLNCLGLGITCVYGTGAIPVLAPISHDGKHPLHEGTNLAQVKIVEKALTRQAGSSPFCPAEGLWTVSFVIVLVHSPDGKKSGLGWPALDFPIIEF